MTYLDLSSEVSDADYRRVLENLLDQFSTWRYAHGWCTDVYLFVGQLTRTYRWDRTEERMRLDIPETRTAAERATDLRELRGRILRFTRTQPDYLDIAKANEFLTLAGLAPYAPEAEPENTPRRYSVSIGARVNSTLTETELRTKLTRYMTRIGAEARSIDIYVTPMDRNRRSQVIPESETTRLIENRALGVNGYSAEL